MFAIKAVVNITMEQLASQRMVLNVNRGRQALPIPIGDPLKSSRSWKTHIIIAVTQARNTRSPGVTQWLLTSGGNHAISLSVVGIILWFVTLGLVWTCAAISCYLSIPWLPLCHSSSQIVLLMTTPKFKATLYSIQASACKSTLRRHGIQAITRVMAYVADATMLWRCLQQCVLAALN
jgi:hypothetical protein